MNRDLLIYGVKQIVAHIGIKNMSDGKKLFRCLQTFSQMTKQSGMR